ncbi:MAG TPA: hypothetical protein PLR86_09010, partial [Planctomycetota bacterium]|nr:hypothetical protein [Planctomycetota bacterium]
MSPTLPRDSTAFNRTTSSMSFSWYFNVSIVFLQGKFPKASVDKRRTRASWSLQPLYNKFKEGVVFHLLSTRITCKRTLASLVVYSFSSSAKFMLGS